MNDIIVAPSHDIAVARDPAVVLQEAKKAAQALMTVVSQKAKPVMMNGEQYLEFEDWQTVARFYNLTVRVARTTFLDFGGVQGFEAVADVLRADGAIVSTAESMCLNDEEKWSSRAKYEWKNGKKEKVGDVPVPLFQLRSMAQTRACAKALRNVLAWVVVLAGFRPTVAEELTGDEETDNRPQSGKPSVQQPQKKAQPQEGAITDSQRKLIYARLKSANIPVEAFQKFFNIESLSDLAPALMNDALAAIKDGKIPVETKEETLPSVCSECGTTDGHSEQCSFKGFENG